jgi:molybdopterin/thiamine biosynthesis adenylyltransferase
MRGASRFAKAEPGECGVVGTLQAMEVIKLVTGIGEPLVGRLLLYDALAARFDTMRYKRA